MIYEQYPYTSADKALQEGCSWLSDLLMPIDQREIEDPQELFEQIRSYFGEALSALECEAFEPVQVGIDVINFIEFPKYEKQVRDEDAKAAYDGLKLLLKGLEQIDAVPDLLTADTVLMIIEGYRRQCQVQLAREACAIAHEQEYDSECA